MAVSGDLQLNHAERKALELIAVIDAFIFRKSACVGF
jgi:hypothetical protein